LRERDVSPSRLLRKAGLSAAQVDTSQARIGAASQVAFLELAASALGEPLLGFTLGRDFDLRQIGLLYYAAASSATLGDALDRAERYSSIVNEGIGIQCTRSADLRISVRYAGVSRVVGRQQAEFLITAVLRVCRTLTNSRLTPKAIRLVHPRLGDPSEFESFVGRRIAFGSDSDELVFDAGARQIALAGADPYLSQMLLRYCEEALSARRPNANPLRIAVENAIPPLLPHGRARIGVVARQLGLSSRTLRRRLADEGLNFSELLDQLRADLATSYLRQSSLGVSQIAWLVGYRGVSAFTHACVRWTGMTPGQFGRRPTDPVRPAPLGKKAERMRWRR
jgi:AraC-like DNA-binding protein